MQQADYVTLLRGSVPQPGGVWADFGSGQGAYTLALAELIGPGSTLYSIDRDAGALAAQAARLASQFPQVPLRPITADFTLPLPPALPPLDGLVLANALHLVQPHHKAALVKLLASYLKPGGRWLLVDYNVDQGNHWVPYPLTYAAWETLARECGLENVRLAATHPDNFLKEVYVAEGVTSPAPAPAAATPEAPPTAAKKKKAASAAAPEAQPAAPKKKAAPRRPKA